MKYIKNINLLRVLFILFFAIATKAQNKIQDSVQIKNVPFNSEYSDFGAIHYNDSVLLFSSSKERKDINQKIWENNKQPFLKVYAIKNRSKNVYKDEDLFDKKNKFKYHVSSIAFNANKTIMYFTANCLSKSESDKFRKLVRLKIYKAQFIGGKWDNIKELPFNSSEYSTGHPWLSRNQKKLYFISDMPGGYGLTDIYEVNILPDGSYSPAVNLGPEINTKGKEMFPFVDENNIMYYSSNGFKDSHGGLDIYYADLNKKPFTISNIGLPINSDSDDFSFFKMKGLKKGYFSSNRLGGKGDDDIYSFEYFFKELNKCRDSIEIVFKDSKTLKPLSNVEVFLKPVYEKLLSAKKTNKNGTFVFVKNCSLRDFEISGFKKDYSQFKKVFKIEKGVNKYIFFLEKDILSEKIVKIIDEKLQIIIGDIYFGYNNFKVSKESKNKLDKLIDIMTRYPKIKIKVNSHTDSRGAALYNLGLSEKRALSIRNYIIEQGIEPKRVFYEGYGETAITNRCLNNIKCTKEEHLMNRRTNFLIIK